jgi:hypothetical protein
VGLEFELRASCIYKAGILLLEPHLQSILLGYFGDGEGGGFMSYLLGLASNRHPPDLSLT